MGRGAQGLLLQHRTPPCGKEAVLCPAGLPRGQREVLQQDMGRPAPLCGSAAANPLPQRPAERLAAAVDRAVCSLPPVWSGPSLKSRPMPLLQEERLGKYLESGRD